ncbi:alpha/beta fold hydrolase [Vibrio sp. D404a]|uniref:alpha/beta hydrolase n=1 Tax=unclassified Vibrio TaxID=2614977 RepID=UPI0025550BC8|nr:MULTISPECIES: alpha/beta fold hydrolase [unclassified Vibrio]MDK9739438.1 alpha/beta fold hydrolase [Vibrio sp. D404a]MDK9798918.1 alpha/beta fold hydrolase [Vibrio sp. D449a]
MLKKALISSASLLSATLIAAAATASEDNMTVNLEQSIKQAIQLDTNVGNLAANLYLPAGIEKPPVVIVTGAWTTVKEQMPATYAKALAEKGYAAVTFDFRGWGQSEDAVQYLENPTRKTEDIRAVIEAVSKLDMIDASKVAGLGICASAGYMLDAVAGNDKVQAAAVVAPWLHDKAMATGIYGGEESAANLIAAAKQAQDSAEPVIMEAASTTNSNALMYQAPYYTETDRGLIPEYDNKFNVASWDGWLNYNGQASAPIQNKPVLMVVSEDMALPAGAHAYLEKANDNVEAIWLEDVTQFDFYDQPKPVADAINAVVIHFEENL